MKFELTEKQVEKANKWMEERKRYSGSIGGQFSFVFTPTSIGDFVEVKTKDESLSLTDYENM